MAGFVYKVIPYNYIEQNLLSSWLEKQAKKGLFFTSFHSFWGRFQKRAPASVRYYILLKKAKQEWITDLEQYESLGWTLVDTANKHFHVFRSKFSHTQPMQADETYLKKEIVKNLWLSIILCILSIFVFVMILTDLIAGDFYFYELFTEIPFLIFPILAFTETIAVFQVWHQLKTGMDCHTSEAYDNFRTVVMILLIVLVVLGILSPILRGIFGG